MGGAAAAPAAATTRAGKGDLPSTPLKTRSSLSISVCHPLNLLSYFFGFTTLSTFNLAWSVTTPATSLTFLVTGGRAPPGVVGGAPAGDLDWEALVRSLIEETARRPSCVVSRASAPLATERRAGEAVLEGGGLLGGGMREIDEGFLRILGKLFGVGFEF